MAPSVGINEIYIYIYILDLVHGSNIIYINLIYIRSTDT